MKPYKFFACLTLFSGIVTSCKTDDVHSSNNGPMVSLSVSKTSISENNGQAEIKASLSEVSSSDILVNLTFTGSATGNGTDYFTSANTITIPAGSIADSISITGVDDTIKEGNETVQVTISSVNGGTAGDPQQASLIIEDDDVPLTPQIIVNEILYDPSNNGLDGDANGDGHYAQNEDEFIEFVNLSAQSVDMSGFKIYDTEAMTAGVPRHIFPAGTVVPSGKAIVVFGGGTPTGSFGGSIVQTSTTGDMNLNNAGDVMTLTDADGNVVVTFDIEPLSNNPNESYTRNPDITGEFEQHGDNTPLLFSPGTKVDGSPF